MLILFALSIQQPINSNNNKIIAQITQIPLKRLFKHKHHKHHYLITQTPGHTQMTQTPQITQLRFQYLCGHLMSRARAKFFLNNRTEVLREKLFLVCNSSIYLSVIGKLIYTKYCDS